MKRYIFAILCFLAAYLAILGPFTRVMEKKPYAIRLGLIPHPKVLQMLFNDYQELLAANILGRVILYYGTLVENFDDPRILIHNADYPAMSRAIHASLQLDPYNMDGYYFGQAILAWDVRQYKLATELLEHGMQYRTWDWQLPFFAGFNYAYFLGDKEKAAKMYMRAGELSGDSLFKSLAGRYLQEAGKTEMAVEYLQTLIKSARNPAVKQSLQVRFEAFKAVLATEQARDLYEEKQGHLPAHIDILVQFGYLSSKPVDPYGGEFYLDESGQVHSTSKFAFATLHRPDGADNKAPASDK
jgi:tetratricopeptide (TPR) repeat protein